MSKVHKKLLQGGAAAEKRPRPSPPPAARNEAPPDHHAELQRLRQMVAQSTEAARVLKAQLAGTEQALREQCAAHAAQVHEATAQAQALRAEVADLRARLAAAQSAMPPTSSANPMGTGSLLSQAQAHRRRRVD